MFLCRDYERKEWPGLEWRAIRDLIKKKEDESIMLIRLDDSAITGLYSIDGVLDATELEPEEIAAQIVVRLQNTQVRLRKTQEKLAPEEHASILAWRKIVGGENWETETSDEEAEYYFEQYRAALNK